MIKLETVFDTYHKPLVIYCNNIIHNFEVAEDIVSEAFVKLWTKLEEFEQVINARRWLYIATRNAAINYLIKEKKDDNKEKKRLYLFNEEDLSQEDMDNSEIEVNVIFAMLKEIESLPKKCKVIFKLLYFEKLNTLQISRKLNISTQTVLNQKTIAIKIIKEKIKNLKII